MCNILYCTLMVHNESTILRTTFLQPVNLAILTIWSLFNPARSRPYPLLICCHPFSPTNHLLVENHRSLIQIMHHSLIHSVSLASHVSTHLFIHLSARLCYHHRSHHPSLLHSFTPDSTNLSHLNTSSTLDCLSRWRDRTGLIMLLGSFFFIFFCLFCMVD